MLVKTDEPVRHKPGKIPVHLVDRVDAEFKKNGEKLGWIERNDNPDYASPIWLLLRNVILMI
jgi:hypothetical protein